MATTIRTRDGDLLDSLCFAYYGRVEGMVEAVLSANRGLSLQPQPFTAGIEIYLPDLAVPDGETVTLWE